MLLAVVLVSFGALIGFIIGLVILIYLIGGMNYFLADTIWGINTASSFWSLAIHGLVLLVVMFVVNIVISLGVGLVVPGIAAFVVVFILQAFADGFVGKSVATFFSQEAENSVYHKLESEQQTQTFSHLEKHKCGNCFWFGKDECERKEEYINANPCEKFRA